MIPIATYQITNGSGTFTNITPGTHNIDAASTTIIGYDKTSLPATVTIDSTGTQVDLAIGATGTLLVRAMLDGTTAQSDVSFIRCNSTGATTYGTAKTTDTNGIATFDHVPFESPTTASTPYIYYRVQNNTGYEISAGTVASIQYNGTDYTSTPLDVPIIATVNANFTVTDSNYTNLPIGSGTLGLED